MKKGLSSWDWIISSILEVALGIILILKPQEFTELIFNIFGIVLIIVGIVNALKYFRTEKEIAIFEHSLTSGIIMILIGTIIIIAKTTLIEWVTIIYGIVILISGIRKVQLTADLIRINEHIWPIACIEAVISVVLGALIIANPFTAVKTLWMFIGISIIINGILDGITAGYMFAVKKKVESLIVKGE